MDENKLRFGVGVLILSSIGIGVILVFLFGAFPAVLNRQYTLDVKFDSAEGIGLNTPVVRDGVKVGRVETIKLVPEGGVLVSLAMDSDKPITRRYVPKIGAGSLVTGESELKFVLADQEILNQKFEADPELIATEYADGDFLDNGEKTKGIFDMEDDLQETIETINRAGKSVDELASNI
ncbi:MAG: MlaD family protein, partial [Planctomycetota bacterium]